MAYEKQEKFSIVRIVVDTNIVFSGILNSSSKIGKLLLNSNSHFEFYSCKFLQIEIHNHKEKLVKLTKLSESELFELESLITSNITFINEELIPSTILKSTAKLLQDIDPKDTPFVALAKTLDAKLWTGDLKLIAGLKSKKIKNTISTAELSFLLDELEQ